MPLVLVRWSARARRDVRVIRAYIGQSSPFYGRRVPEYDRPEIRELVEPPYRIIYRYVGGAAVVDVLTVVHGRQRMPERV